MIDFELGDPLRDKAASLQPSLEAREQKVSQKAGKKRPAAAASRISASCSPPEE